LWGLIRAPPRGIRNPGVLRVMPATPRHLFVPHPSVETAYSDISQPYIVALMTELLAPVGHPIDQELVVLEKDAAGHVRRRMAGPVVFVEMKPGEKPK
jgi:protein-L-isoaspartate O-methyltransferase